MGKQLRSCVFAAITTLVAACGSQSTVQVAGPAPTPTTKPSGPPAPWERTEERETCENFSITRAPFFGDTHVHTTHSIDAVVFNVLGTPTDAYKFARGEEIRLAPYDPDTHRPLKLRRPLDFAAVSDHSEGFGVYQVCFDPSYPGYNSEDCGKIREASVSADPATIRDVFFSLLVPVVISPNPHYPVNACGDPPTDCQEGTSVVWQEAQETAEQFYDRTAECKFTSFVGYEYTANTAKPNVASGANLHRNVIFRNAVVPDLPVTYIDQPFPQNMWRDLREKCQDAPDKATCDWLAIPHNSNISGGHMFLTENPDGSAMSTADAKTRAANEPLVEIYQHKGSSECRTGAGTTDEQCGFELTQRIGIFQDFRDPATIYPANMYVRDALKVGLAKEQELGANPFQYGVIASTDTHNAIPGATVETDFQGHQGLNDDTVPKRLYLGGPPPTPGTTCDADPNNVRCGRGRADDGSGGLAVVWAEENSRDALFSGMRRRETYGTSGTRPILRFFAGDYAASVCEESDSELATTGYRRGVPMGAEIGPYKGMQSPTFTVLAVPDPGEPAVQMGDKTYPAIPGTPLQLVQIVKGWVDSTGTAHEKVFDVAGNATADTALDVATCTRTPAETDADILCTAWTDPEFDATQRAFYYVRVLEQPTCRWSTMQCNEEGVDCTKPESVPPKLVACCDPTVPKTLQERAWSSPIWYRPEGMGAVAGTISFGSSAAKDTLQLEVPLGAGAPHDLNSEDLTVIVRDNDVIYQATLPAGTVKNGVYEDDAGSIGSVRKVTFTQTDTGSTLTLETVPTDLSKAEQLDHMVEVEVRIGAYAAAQTRLWTLSDDTLGTTS